MTLCCPLPYLLHVAPLEKGRWHPRKGYNHLLHPALDDAVTQGRQTTSSPSPPALCNHPCRCAAIPGIACRAIPRTVGTQVDRTSPRPPLRSRRSSVSQALELVYGRQSDKRSSATTLVVAPGRVQDPSRRLPEARFARKVVNSTTLYAMLPHTILRATRHDCKPPSLAL
jgi:hypothetical protein